MKIAIMQPYFFPYIGYFQLINSVDEFIVYDNIKFTKKGWIHRNRILQNNKDEYISLQLKNASDFLFINDRELADSFEDEKLKILRRISSAYSKAPYFNNVFPVLDQIIMFEEKNLFRYIFNSIKVVCEYLTIKTKFIISSEININHNLKAQEKVIALVKASNANQYINAIGGIELYAKNEFALNNINLNFIKTNDIKYKQFNEDFIPYLSIIDVLMFNSKNEISEMLNKFELI